VVTNIKNPIISLTHSSPDILTKEDIAEEMNQIKTRLMVQFKDNPQQLESLLKSVDELSDFELGRFAIKNKGALSGYWTWYVILGYKRSDSTSPLEQFIIEKSPTVLATQERFKIFQTLLTKYIQSNSTVCSIPCGMMADLFTLNLPDKVNGVRFVGIDIDKTVFDLARDLAKKLKVRFPYDFFYKNAWDLNIENEFDIITSNGLNNYEKDDDKVVALYRGLHTALKAKGRLICSALTLPPVFGKESEWDMDKIDKDNLLEAATLFSTILEATWANFRTSEKTSAQLREAGFKNIEIHWDSQKIFPTFSAQK
jgi:SAM-dependent methyltransferase